MFLNRFSIVPALSSAARIPLVGAVSSATVFSIACENMGISSSLMGLIKDRPQCSRQQETLHPNDANNFRCGRNGGAGYALWNVVIRRKTRLMTNLDWTAEA